MVPMMVAATRRIAHTRVSTTLRVVFILENLLNNIDEFMSPVLVSTVNYNGIGAVILHLIVLYYSLFETSICKLHKTSFFI